MSVQIIEEFYEAFQKLDADTMVNCYHEEVTFQDPAFGILHGQRAKNMWRMLCSSQKGKDFRVNFSDVQFQDGLGTANWEAFYTFSATGRKVHNVIKATFKFKEGKIIEHIDDFDLHKWAKQAMGIKGLLLGGTKFFERKLNSRTNHLLDKYVFAGPVNGVS